MDLRQRWIIARQDQDTNWEFFVDRGRWTSKIHDAALFYTLWGAEEAHVHSAGGQGTVRNAAEIYEFAGPASPAAPQTSRRPTHPSGRTRRRSRRRARA